MFKVGQKVVCVKPPDVGGWWGWEEHPVIGETYTVRGCFIGSNGMPAILLEEIVNEPAEYASGFREFGFRANRFRPIDPLQEKLDQLEKESILELELVSM